MPPKTFGLTSSFRGRGRGKSSSSSSSSFSRSNPTHSRPTPTPIREEEGSSLLERFHASQISDEIDLKLGFETFDVGRPRLGWMVNMSATLLPSDLSVTGQQAVNLYFVQDDGSTFKSTVAFNPYFYILTRSGAESVVEEWLKKKFQGQIASVSRRAREDLSLPNHLVAPPPVFLVLHFFNMHDLLSVRREVLPLAQANMKKKSAVETYVFDIEGQGKGQGQADEPADLVMDCREYDVPYYLRVAIDLDFRVGLWYTVTANAGSVTLERMARESRAEPVVLAYDIEVTKPPLKFPDAAQDVIMMISYMIDGQGFLITNREIVSEDIEDFEYTPKDEYEGPFTIFNEPDECAVIKKFFQHFREARPTVVTTYNGDSFDFPFVDARAKVHGLDIYYEIGFSKDAEDEYKSKSCMHMDCFKWVKRDSYLPQGSQGLKAVTTAKLGYNPIELDPELMTPYASEQPQILAQYSVSDAVATYYLYMKYVHPFIFSLCNIIPLNPDEVLRKGSGTLCETLLMVEAYQANIIMPNRHVDDQNETYEGHLLASETYVGGHVEALEAGVFRSDIPTHFRVEPTAMQQLIDDLDAALEFSIRVEGNLQLEDVENYDEIKGQIQEALEVMRDNPNRLDPPLIYHLDVAAMYPNIMLSNRLQPDSVVTEATCATCDYNRPGKTCDRRMNWAWRGEYFPARREEYNMIKHALDQEWFPGKWASGPKRKFVDLSPAEQTALLHKRLGDYSRKVYKKTHETKVIEREAIICQRENPFYIDTVRAFRDRRYEYKGLHKAWKKKLDIALGGGSLTEVVEAKKMIVLYDSLQLAHKCILNSFYGYVMRKGARWYSMEMAGITCLTGAHIIQMARQLVEQIGRPLELDTDGIWCMLPGTFPENFDLKLKNGKTYRVQYPCTMLNHLVHAQFTNKQYHTLIDKNQGTYEVKAENSIFFELDGPYRAMILPSSKEEDKLLKKRYAVFEHDGSLAELKGFEVKRRGELQLIKIFQSQIFEKFLLGKTTEECYAAVAEVADQWLDVLWSKGSTLQDEELIELIAENRSMSKTLAEYGGQKSTSISTAKRLAEFLGEGMVKDKGLSCRFIVSAKPYGAPVTERAVPVAIFTADPAVRTKFLRKWLKDNSLIDFDLRIILDWGYYKERFGSVIQKLITIPAALQKIANPVPRIVHPDWLLKRVARLEDKFQQHRLDHMFARQIQQNGSAAAVTNGEPKQVAKKSQALAPVVKAVPMPDPFTKYSAWLRRMRSVWRDRRQQASSSTENTKFGSSRGALGSIMAKQAMTLTSHVWDVVQIVPLPKAGEFKIWLAIGSSLQALKLYIPREFYVNFKHEPDGLGKFYQAERATKSLPRGQACLNLYHFSVDEHQFQGNEPHFSQLLDTPNVEGVYEMQVPLAMRAILKLGSSCLLSSSAAGGLGRILDRGVNLDDLSHSTASGLRRNYLNNGEGLRYVYIFHATTSSRHIFGLFDPNGALKVFLVDTARNRPVLPNLEKFYVDALKAVHEKISDNEMAFTYPSELNISSTAHTTEDSALKALSRALSAIGGQRHGPAIAIINSPRPQHYFDQNVPALAEYPTFLTLPPKPESGFSIMWQQQVPFRMIRSYVRCSHAVKERLMIASYFDVPLCNLQGDQPLLLADIDFSRRLQAQDMVLWWSPTPKPDLGGKEADAPPQQALDELVAPEFSNPGIYSNVSLEVELRDLAINAVLQSALVNEVEGSGAASAAFGATAHNLDDYNNGQVLTVMDLGDSVMSTQAFSVLKTMVKSWYLQKTRSPNEPLPHLLVEHFWRWVSSSSANMFEPGLYGFLHGLMRKTFLQMLAEIKRLGSGIVYADFTRIFILTSKPTAGAALAYGNYIVSAINSHELFRHVSLSIKYFWDYLVWMDCKNFAGVIENDPESLKTPEQRAFNVTMQWNIKSFLPTAIQPVFQNSIASFIYDMYSFKAKHHHTQRAPLRSITSENINAPTSNEGEPVEVKTAEGEFAKKHISTVITRKLLKTVTDLLRRQTEMMLRSDETDDFTFPLLPGSHLHFTNPVLEFIKSICAVLGLDPELSNQTQVLKRNLLELINIREFSDQAQFKNPCESFKLSLVACSQCSTTREIDLCRDPDILGSVVNLEAGDYPVWSCSHCSSAFDRTGIEMTLIALAERHIAAFQTQDMRCAKCKNVMTSHLLSNCDCSGVWNLQNGKNEILRKLKTYSNVADYHRLDILRAFILQNCPEIS